GTVTLIFCRGWACACVASAVARRQVINPRIFQRILFSSRTLFVCRLRLQASSAGALLCGPIAKQMLCPNEGMQQAQTKPSARHLSGGRVHPQRGSKSTFGSQRMVMAGLDPVLDPAIPLRKAQPCLVIGIAEIGLARSRSSQVPKSA